MRTSELIGPALDWAVAKCEGHALTFFDDHFRRNGLASGKSEAYVDSMLKFQLLKGKWVRLNAIGGCTEIYGYSIDWEYGGPIIEREGINTFKYNKLDASEHDKWGAHKVVPRKAMDGVEYSAALCLDGPTPPIAAMRCYVASKLGDEVEIPEELQ